MKNTIISNLIDFVVYHDIKENDHIEKSVYSKKETVPGRYNQFYGIESEELWFHIVEDFKLDKITTHLFENFSNAIDREDYKSAAILKQEILNWYYLNEGSVLNIGGKYISELKNGLIDSELLKDLVPRVDKIERVWDQNGVKSSYGITEELMMILEEFNKHDSKMMFSESLNFITNFDFSYSHPTTIIERAIEFFSILTKRKRN